MVIRPVSAPPATRRPIACRYSWDSPFIKWSSVFCYCCYLLIIETACYCFVLYMLNARLLNTYWITSLQLCYCHLKYINYFTEFYNFYGTCICDIYINFLFEANTFQIIGCQIIYTKKTCQNLVWHILYYWVLVYWYT